MARAFPNLPLDFEEHLDLFIVNFVGKHKQSRWRSVLAMKPEKWRGASAYDCSVDATADWNTPPEDTIRREGLERYIDTPALVFPIGHAAGAPPFRGTLRGALLSSDRTFECVVSILPGKLAVCYGHSNEVRICKR